MKTFLTFLSAVLLIISIGCTTGKNFSSNQKNFSTITGKNLASYISTIPRLRVTQGQVYNRTTSTFQQTTKPLFILDGVQVGRDFRRVLSLINENREVEVEFVKMSRATVRYGGSGRNGLIVIKTS